MRRFAVLSLLFLVTACATDKFGGVSRSYQFSPDTKHGIVFLSTSIKNADNSDCGPGVSVLWFERADGSNFLRKNFLLDNPYLGSFFEDSRGYFINLELPEGEYVITDLQYGSYESSAPLDMRFRVSAGKVHYLGQINVTIKLTCLSYDVAVRDRRDRDVPIFVGEMKNFGHASIDYQILKP